MKDTGDFTYRDKSILPHEIQKLGEQRWGIYAPAIAKWERILGRPAPEPTDEKRRLNPDFVAWMMGLPENWLHGSRTQQLKQCGNAVVPQQGAYAIRALVSRFNDDADRPRFSNPHYSGFSMFGANEMTTDERRGNGA